MRGYRRHGLPPTFSKDKFLKKSILIVLFAVAASAAAAWYALRPDPDALLSIMSTKCLGKPKDPNAQTPCVKVDRPNQYVVLKDRKGSRHFLLLPMMPLPGIESDALLTGDLANYFKFAWENRGLLSPVEARPVADDNVMLAVNSRSGRTQNQLHIHISCTKFGVKDALAVTQSKITASWSELPVELEGHSYWARRVSLEEFDGAGAFAILASGIPEAASDMGNFSVAMTQIGGEDILLATRRDLLDLNLASAEELQDHDCGT
jgi:CDP-diacylglycerol pyrophosphatase